MKKSLFAAGLALMAGAPSAFALDPVANPTPDAVFYAGGGSAVSQVSIWVAEKLMTNVHIITSDASCASESTTHRIFYGNLRSAAGTLPAGAKVVLMYRFSGGSFPNGAIAQAKGTTLAYPNVAGFGAATTTGCTGAALSTASSNTKPAYKIAFGTTVNAIPDWGIPDEEIGLLNTPVNLPSGQTLLTSTQIGNVSQEGVLVTAFGVAVSENVSSPSTANGNCAKTSISRAEMAGVLAGSIQDWSQLEGDNGCAIAPGPIHLIDRTKGSGSKAASNEFFLKNPTAAGASLPGNFNGDSTVTVDPLATTCNASGFYSDISVGSNSAMLSPLNRNGDVTQTCRMITAVLSGEFPPAKNPPTAADITAGAIGPTANYKFLKIDGIDPGFNNPTGQNLTYDNIINGKYEFAYTSVFVKRNALTGNALTMANRVKGLFQDPSLVAGAGSGNLLSASGLLLDPNVAPSLSRCVMRTTRFGTSTLPMSLFYTFDSPLPAPAPSGCADLN